MLYKVEICGINTSTLEVLSENEKMRLLKEMRQGNTAARDRLISGNLRLVLSVVQRFTGRGENLDDLFQVGCIGLIKSVDNFDITLDVRFSTYAVPMILGEIRRYLRDNNPIRISRTLRDIAYRAMQARERLTAQLQRSPTTDELAKELDLPVEDVVMALESIVDPNYQYEPVYSDNGGDELYVMDQVSDGDGDKNWIDELSLKESFRSLSPRERKILHLRYFRGLTQMEVSQEIGISQAQVSRLEKCALSRIKGQL